MEGYKSAHDIAKKLLNFKKNFDVEDSIKSSGFDFFGYQYRNELTMKILRILKWVDLSVLIMVLSSYILSVYALERNMEFKDLEKWDDSYNDKPLPAIIIFTPFSPPVPLLRLINSIMTVLIEIGIVLHYIIKVKYDKFRMVVPKDVTFCSLRYSLKMVLELFLNAFHTPYGLDGSIELPQRSEGKSTYVNFDVVLTIFLLFFRSYHLLKYFAFHSKWNNIYTEKICEASNVKFDFSFCLKAQFKDRPYLLVSLVLVGSIFIFGYSLRCAEMFFMNFTGTDSYNMNWKDIWNGFWCVIITMTTVGFGDFYAISILGRIISIIAAFWGTFLISLMVAALSNMLEFNCQEAAAYATINSENNEREYGLQAVLLLQSVFRYLFHMKKLNADKLLINEPGFRTEKSKLFANMKHNFETFRKIKSIKERNSFYSEIEKIMKKINVNISNEMDRIKEEITVMPEIKKLLQSYHTGQEVLKIKILELYKELEEISIFKNHFVKYDNSNSLTRFNES